MPESETILALGVDDPSRERAVRSALVRAGVKAAVSAEGPAELVSVCAGLDPQPDAVILAWRDQRDVLEGLKLLRAQFDGRGRLVAVVDVRRSAQGRRALAAGADGIVPLDELDATLGVTLDAVVAGQLVVPRELARSVEKPALSQREKQALALVVMGMSNAEIAGRLVVTEYTVKSHLSSAFRKLGVRTRSEAAAMILDPDEGLGTGILSITGS